MGSLLSRRTEEDAEAAKKATHGSRNDLIPPDILEQILEGKTCTPVSLLEFREFLATKEYSAENLDAYEWFQAYRKRFFSLPEPDQRLSPPPSTSETQRPVDPSIQPLRTECTAAVQNFYCSSAPQELNIPSKLQAKVRKELEATTHPDVFESSIHHCVELMRSSSLPKFLKGAARNIDSREEVLERGVKGLCWISIPVAIMIVLLYYHQSRWYRLFIFPPLYMSLLYFQTAQTQMCFTYMGKRQREVLLTEMTDEQKPKAHIDVFTTDPTVFKGKDGEGEVKKRKGGAKPKIVGKTFKDIEEPLVFKIQAALKRKVLIWGAVGSVVIVAVMLAIPEDAWKR
ncbi:hypothetical protein HDV00_010560 [Rhizophlyctis rosea]|nr:hypothetical protein HDV00_010560 [Rhizophlyctis rosea]